MKRVFAAIDISDEVRAAIRSYTSELCRNSDSLPIRLEKPEKLHITIRFAGSLNDEQLDLFSGKISQAAASAMHFRAKVAGTGAFLKRRGPSVLWLGIEVLSEREDPFKLIAAHFNDKPTSRPLRPHITIARLKDPESSKTLVAKHLSRNFESPEFKINEVVLYESKLLLTGSIYTKLNSFPLGNRPSFSSIHFR